MGKQKLIQEQRQHLSVRQLQQVSLLALPTVAIEERVQEELNANPALEVDPDRLAPKKEEAPAPEVVENPSDNYLSEDDIPDYEIAHFQEQEDKRSPIAYPADSIGLRQHLQAQVDLLSLDDKEQLIAEQLIGNLSEDGYLRTSSQEIANYLLFYENSACSPQEVEAVLAQLQRLDPPGIAARSLQECLLIQLRQLPPSPTREHAMAIVGRRFDLLAMRHYEQIARSEHMTLDEVKAAQAMIVSLNPKPGNGFGSNMEAAASRIVPDFIVHATPEGLEISLNEGSRIPPLRVTPSYQLLSQERAEKNRNAEQVRYARELVSQAKWFIEMIERRRDTLLRTMEVIASIQEDFFYSGSIQDLKPMVLKEVAAKTGHDISTISRIGNEKYVQSDFGVYPIKFFFNEASPSSQGEKKLSNRNVVAMLQAIVATEDKQKPLTDSQLGEALQRQGVTVARRTIAKYRDVAGILPARLRRQIDA